MAAGTRYPQLGKRQQLTLGDLTMEAIPADWSLTMGDPIDGAPDGEVTVKYKILGTPVRSLLTLDVVGNMRQPPHRVSGDDILKDIVQEPDVLRGDEGPPIDWRPILAYAYPLAACLLAGFLLKGMS